MPNYKITTLDDYGLGSLREAIKYSNQIPCTKIVFTIPGTIFLTNDLPIITKPTMILGQIKDNKPQNTINGNSLYTIINIFETEKCSIKGICIINSKESGINIHKSSKIKIEGCFIGTNTNNECNPNKNGISLYKSNYNYIGPQYNKFNGYNFNIISGNKECGITLVASNKNIIGHNIIGLNSQRNTKCPNLNGIKLSKSFFNIIGGKGDYNSKVVNEPTEYNHSKPEQIVKYCYGNIISGNIQDGILIEGSSQTEVFGNFIGTNETGLLDFGNGNNGISIVRSKTTSIIGCSVDNTPNNFYNIISCNSLAGINISDSNYTIVQGNYIGVNSHNNKELPNSIGIKICGSSAFSVIGGCMNLGNIISGNKNEGIYLTGKSTKIEIVNSIVGLFSGGTICSNGGNGILIDETVQFVKIFDNILSGNECNGILVKGDVKCIRLQSNKIGVDASGTTPMPNKQNGIKICENSSNVEFFKLGSNNVVRNTISGNFGNGIYICDNASKVKIFDTIIGIDSNCNKFISNGQGGIILDNNVEQCIIGEFRKSNYVYNSGDYSIICYKNTNNNKIINNFINMNLLYQNNNLLKCEKNILDKSTKNVVFNNICM